MLQALRLTRGRAPVAFASAVARFASTTATTSTTGTSKPTKPAADSLGLNAAGSARRLRVQTPRAPHNKWLVADMDSTLINRTFEGNCDRLDRGPCYEPVLEWLERGGNLCVITTATDRTFEQVWDCIPAPLRANGRVVLSMSEGANLVYGDSAGQPALDRQYRTQALPGGTCLRPHEIGPIVKCMHQLLCRLFGDMLRHPEYVQLLSRKYHEPLTELLQELAGPSALPIDVQLPLSRFLEPGGIMKATGEKFISINRVQLPSQVRPGDTKACPPLEGESFSACSVSVMGVPMALADRYLRTTDRKLMRQLGADVALAPNSLHIKRHNVDKAAPLVWMSMLPRYRFSFNNAVALGDSPHGNDAPLATFAPFGMDFVSVAPQIDQVPVALRPLHVGGLEHGTARVIDAIVDHMAPRVARGPLPFREVVRRAVADVRDNFYSYHMYQSQRQLLTDRVDGRDI